MRFYVIILNEQEKGANKMKDKDFDIGNRINFKDLADKIGEVDLSACDELDEDAMAEFLCSILPDVVSNIEPCTKEDIYDEILENFYFLIKAIGVEEFSFFRFSNPDYCREIIIDGKEYDLDGMFTHDDEDETGALCAIDSLIGDIVCEYDESEEEILKKIQAMINIKNGK